jgi:flagellar motor component MotA
MPQDLYTEIIKSTQMTNTFDRDSFIADYAELVVDGMDMDTLVRFAFDMLVENMERMSDNELVEEANEYYPELLIEYNIDPDIYI